MGCGVVGQFIAEIEAMDWLVKKNHSGHVFLLYIRSGDIDFTQAHG